MSRSFTGEQRRELARRGLAMPDGGYPIRNKEDLKNAIQAYGRGTNSPAVKKWIKKRAKELDAEDMLPENWEIAHSDDELMHYGVKGMKWGVRRKARKDAKEYSRAKMYYGEGAGNRRKLINATVKERSKDPEYKKAFDEALSRQDMSKHASAAKRERKAADVKKGAGKMGRGLINAATGNIGRASAAAVVVYAGLHYSGADKVIASMAKQKVSQVVDNVKGAAESKKILDEMLRNARRK